MTYVYTDPLLFSKRNTKTIKIEPRVVAEFDMMSWNEMYNIFNSDSVSESSIQTFFGIALADDPIIEVYGVTDPGKGLVLNDHMRRIFREYWVPFLREWWICYYTTGILSYTIKYDNEYMVYVPIVFKAHKEPGKVRCLVDHKKTENTYVWSWSGEGMTVGQLKYDPNIEFFEIWRPSISNKKDNLMEWINYTNMIANNKHYNTRPSYLHVPFETPLKKIILQYLDLKRLKNAGIQTEEIKSQTTTFLQDDKPYTTDEFHNFVGTYREIKDKLSKDRSYSAFHNMDPEPVYQTPMDIGSIGNPTNQFTHGNDITSIFNPAFDAKYEAYGQDEVLNVLDQQLKTNYGITRPSLKIGHLETIIVPPGQKPVFAPKYNSKDLGLEMAEMRRSFMELYGVSLPEFGSGSRVAAESLRIANDLLKHRFNIMIKQMESFINKITHEIIGEDFKIVKQCFLGKISGCLDQNVYEIGWHFIPNFSVDIDKIAELMESGFIPKNKGQDIIFKSFGLFDTIDQKYVDDDPQNKTSQEEPKQKAPKKKKPTDSSTKRKPEGELGDKKKKPKKDLDKNE